jgi:hypothetical protein
VSAGRHALIVLALAGAAFGSAYWQAEIQPASSSEGQAARFVCPLH